MPHRTGNGLAMRAGMVLEALAADHDVDLLVVPCVVGSTDPRAVAWARARCKRLAVLRPTPGAAAPLRASEASAALDTRLQHDEVHVFRLYVVPLVARILEAETRAVLAIDVDEDDADVHRRLSVLYAARSCPAEAAWARREAERYELFARCFLPLFPRIHASSEAERRRARERSPTSCVTVVPNGVHTGLRRAPSSLPANRSLLFVGNLGYLPNEDAVRYFCADVLPRMRRSVRVSIVGANAPAALREIARPPNVRFSGGVERLSSAYRQARAAVVPLRAGGGTRIKILEAFARGRPVVSTRLGARGLEVRHGEHLLIADGARAFAVACERVLHDDDLARSLVDAAHELVARRHSPTAIRQALRRAHGHA
jgi:glycosyltransferase involved in cell wall biosynthesis